MNLQVDKKKLWVYKTWILFDIYTFSKFYQKYEVHTISFQIFFVWAFKIVVDSW